MALGSLRIDVGANIAGFVSDMGRASRVGKKNAVRIERNIKKAVTAITVATTAAAVSITKMIGKTADLGDSLSKMSQKLGVSVSFLSKYDFLTGQAGTNLQTFSTGLKKMEKTINDANNGLSTATRALDSIGVSLDTLNNLSPEEQFDLISKSLSKVEVQSVKTGAAMDIFGRAGTELIPLIDLTAQEVDKLTAANIRFGAQINDVQANAAVEYIDAMDALNQNAQGFSQTLSFSLIPALTEIITQFNDSTVRDASDDWNSLSNVLSSVYGGSLLVREGFATIGKSIGLMATQSIQVFDIVANGLENFVNRFKRGALIISRLWDDTAKEAESKLGKEISKLSKQTNELLKQFQSNEAKNAFLDDVSKSFETIFKRIEKVKGAFSKQRKEFKANIKPAKDFEGALKGIGDQAGITEKELGKLGADFDSIADSLLSPLEKLKDQYDENILKVQEWQEANLDNGEILGLTNLAILELTERLEAGTQALKEVDEVVKEVDFSKMFDGFASGLNPAISSLQSFKDELYAISELMERGALTGGQQAFYSTGLAAEFALNSMADMAKQGSDAQKKLAAAAAITNTILGITAILEQGKGDPYTAFARMAAMAAMVASMGVQVAGAFGGSGGGAEQQQATQGTGTVLGDAEAKSESISNSLDIIASASEQIVGINSKMLRSLNNMSNAIAGTVTEIGKLGEIGDLGTRASGFGGITGAIDGLIFGGSKVKDRGIQILAGGISEAIDGTLFQAYEVAKRRGLFGSSTRTNTGALEDGITDQIGLIFESMTDTILAGAEALGVDLGAVQSALDAYQIQEQRISLLDLNPEEQRAELEAVFSSIFDGLTAFSIPFITQFQQAGEGLGETLARVATTVLVFEEAIESMGLEFIEKQIDPELFAQAAVAIADFAGGMEEFIDGYSAYVSNFLSETEQFNITAGRINGIFSDLEISLPGTRQGFTELIQGLDLTTEAGQKAFGILISLSSEIDSYFTGFEKLWDSFYDTFYTAQENAERSLSDATATRDDLLGDLGVDTNISAEAFREMFENLLPTLSPEQIVQWLEAAKAIGIVLDLSEDITAQALAVTAQALAVEEALAAEIEANALALAEMVEGIESSLEDLDLSPFAAKLKDISLAFNEQIKTANLLGASERELALIQRFATRQIQDAIKALESSVSVSITDLYGTQLDIINEQINALQGQQALSQQLAQASAQRYADELAALANLSNFIDSIFLNPTITTLNPLEQLQEAQNQFNELFSQAQGGDAGAINALPGIVSTLLGLGRDVFASSPDFTALFDMITGQLESLGISGPSSLPQVSSVADPRLIELQTQQTLLLDQIANGERFQEVLALAAQIRELASVTDGSFVDLAERLGLPIDRFISDLGVNLDDLTIDTATALADVAQLLGIELTELASSVGVSLGDLADSESLLNDALEAAIGTLPDGIQGSLTTLLENVENAADGTEQELRLAELAAFAADLPADQREALEPFFDQIDPTTDAQRQLDQMMNIDQSNQAIEGAIVGLRESNDQGLTAVELSIELLATSVDELASQLRSDAAANAA